MLWLTNKILCSPVVVFARSIDLTQPFPPPTLPVSPGSIVNVTCETDSANPTADITWKRNSVVIVQDDTFTITMAEREGEYNANHIISALSFIATQEHHGQRFSCEVTGHSDMTASSTLTLKGKSHRNTYKDLCSVIFKSCKIFMTEAWHFCKLLEKKKLFEPSIVRNPQSVTKVQVPDQVPTTTIPSDPVTTASSTECIEIHFLFVQFASTVLFIDTG